MATPSTTDHYLRPTSAVDPVTTEHGVRARLGTETVEVDVVRADVVRLRISRAGRFDESPTFALCVDPLAWPDGPVPFTVERDDDAVRLRTDRLVVTLGLTVFRLDVHRTDGRPVAVSADGPDGRPWPYATLNDAWEVRRRIHPSDAVYGLGEKTGRHNRRGRDFTLWNTDVLEPKASGEFAPGLDADDPRADNTGVNFDPYYVSIPFFHHLDHRDGSVAGSFVDNGYRAAYDFSAPEEYRIHLDGGQYCEYVFAGPAMADVLEAYTWLTGRTALPPLWSLGFHQCRWFAYDQAAIEGLGARYRAEQIPCDALWLDIDYMDGFRVFTWDPERFPDVPGMLGRLAAQGLRVVTIIDPGVKHDPGYWVYDQAVERDLLCRTEGGDTYLGQVWPGDTAFPDFVIPEARAWWGELNAAHVASGLAGIWNDMNEPATGGVDPRRMRFGRGEYSHERFHNQYALLMAMGTTDGLRTALPDRRPFVLSRAGSAGIQRYAANWLGDNMSRWDHLWMSIPMANGFGLSGQAFVGADVGGFGGDGDGELLLRWSQYGALTPFFRNHTMSGTVDQYPWAFGDDVLALVRDAIRLRYRLLPYVYAAFVVAGRTGLPVQRPLVLDYQDDPAVRDIDDQYLFGPDLLVAPVVEPGVTTREVYLPAGGWYDWWTDEVVAGARTVTAPTPREHLPLYVRAGALIPMWPDAPPSTDGYQPTVVELHLYLPIVDGTTTALLQEDDGVSTDALHHDLSGYVLTTFAVTRTGDRVTVLATATGTGFTEHRREAFVLVLHGVSPDSVVLDGVAVPVVERRAVLRRGAEGFEVELSL